MKQLDEQTIRRIANQMYLIGYDRLEVKQLLDKRQVPEEKAQEIIATTFAKIINQQQQQLAISHSSSDFLWKGIGALVLGLIPLLFGLSSLDADSPIIWIGGIILGLFLIAYGVINIIGDIQLKKDNRKANTSSTQSKKKKDISTLHMDCDDCSATGFVQKEQKSPFGVMKVSVPCEGCGGLGMH